MSTDNIPPKKLTPTENELTLRMANFANLAEALDYAAQGVTGCNFYSGSKLKTVLPYSQLREDAIAIARRLCAFGVERGGRVAIVADTDPDFLRMFFACQYAGLVPVPMPAFVHMGGHKAFVDQLRRLLLICKAEIAVAPQMFFKFLAEAAEELNLRFVGTPENLAEFPQSHEKMNSLDGHELAYLQYTSGSTRFPRGVMIDQYTVMDNLAAISIHGSKIRKGDRFVSWLPFYHDMGLVGLVLVPVATQMSVDYLNTRDFAMRPRQWLTLMSQNRGTVSISPPFGYDLCAHRVRENDIAELDLSSWRIAGVGAEMIRSEPLENFAKILSPSGFDRNAFLPCYGMAECSLAVSFAPLDKGLDVDLIDSDRLSENKEAIPVTCSNESDSIKAFVKCGVPLPGYDVEIRDNKGRVLPERQCGTLFVKGPSVMSGYFNDIKATREVLSPDGWFNTGDLAYMIEDNIVITGREKDLIIINGRNIWPQDLEYLAELQDEVRLGDAAAFTVEGPDAEDRAVMMIECRESNAAKRRNLTERLNAQISEEFGVDCMICLVPRNTLPRTTSGKLSRSTARNNFLEMVTREHMAQPEISFYETVMLNQAL